jgi:lysophospholipase L1-like esterase
MPNICRLSAIIAPLVVTLAWIIAPEALAQDAATTAAATTTLHPALFLVGDSIMKTGSGNGESGRWGWGSEIVPLFDSTKVHVYNEGRGGRSSRSYIEEGLWSAVLARLEPGDFVIIQFGHNDAANSQAYPDRTSLKGSGDETQDAENSETGKKTLLHTYGWYLRQYVEGARAKGATAIICSPVPRNTWIDGKIKRGFDGYAQWAADAAKSSGVPFIDLNSLAADRYDVLGQANMRQYFADLQHATKAGARINAEAVTEGLSKLQDCPLASNLIAGHNSPESTPH